MSRRHEAAVFVYLDGVSVVVPERSESFLLRHKDCAIGRRRRHLVEWHKFIDDEFLCVETQQVSPEIETIEQRAARIWSRP